MNAMVAPAREVPGDRFSFDWVEPMDAQIARLESDVHHIQSDTTEIKENLRRTDSKIDGMHVRLDTLRDKVDLASGESTRRIESVREILEARFESARSESSDKLSAVRDDLAGKIDALRDDVSGRLEGIRSELNDRIDNLRLELSGRIDGVRFELGAVKESVASAKLWALSLHLSLTAGLLLVMARGFKWL